MLGEVGLTGEVRAIGGLETRLREAAALGFGQAVVPRSSLVGGSAVSAHGDRGERRWRRRSASWSDDAGRRGHDGGPGSGGRGRRGRPADSASAAITVARVIFVSLVGYGGYLLVESFEPPARWFALGAAGGPGRRAGRRGRGRPRAGGPAAADAAARFSRPSAPLGGVLLAQLVASALIVFVPAAGSSAGRGFLSLLLAYMGVVFVLRREEELGGITRIVFPRRRRPATRATRCWTRASSSTAGSPTSARRGSSEGTLLIPQYVLRELQQIADSSDPLKRNRGRRGLDVLQRLQRLPGVRTELHDLDFPHIREVDARLIETARAVGGVIVTNDYNLNKVAELHGVRVLNVNELAGALRPVVLPGEMLHVHVLREGKEAGQGVGVPRRRDDGGRRAGPPAHRPDGERHGQHGPPDRRRAHDLHPAGGGRGRRPPVTRPASSGPDVWVVVPAGGRGVRMGRKKQDIRLGGRPVLRWTLDVLRGDPARSTGVVVAVPAEDVEAWRRRLAACRKVRAVVAGGARAPGVGGAGSGRGAAGPPAWILVHDGVRPCITPELVASGGRGGARPRGRHRGPARSPRR